MSTSLSVLPKIEKIRGFQKASEGASKKLRTRALILDTAIDILAEKGIGRTTILDVTERAGLANGSLYYHFRDKAELVDAVSGAVAATLVQEVDEAISTVQKGTERVAVATMLFIERGLENRAWGRLIVNALAELSEFREQIVAGIRKDVRIGIADGSFKTNDSPEVFSMLLAIVGAAMRERLQRDDPRISVTATEAILRVLGISVKNAEAMTVRAKKQIENRAAL